MAKGQSGTVAHFALERLREHGIRRVYGYPGDGLNGLYDAKLDHQPVVAIVGQQKTISLGVNYQQEIDLNTLFKDVASEFVQVCMSPPQIAHLLDRAVQVAKASRSVTAVIVPEDVQEATYEEPPREHGVVYSSPDGRLRARVIPPDSEIRRAAEV